MKNTTYALSLALLLSVSTQTFGMHRPMNCILSRQITRAYTSKPTSNSSALWIMLGATSIAYVYFITATASDSYFTVTDGDTQFSRYHKDIGPLHIEKETLYKDGTKINKTKRTLGPLYWESTTTSEQ